jgi:transcriptional regulator with XRE-family HTH domain
MSDGEPEKVGPMLRRMRLARGLNQQQVAERLSTAAHLPTVSRHEVSRWERGERVPGPFWLGWLAVVLETSLERLEAAVAVTRGSAKPAPRVDVWRRRDDGRRLWRQPVAVDLLAALDHGSVSDVVGRAHAWLAGPPEAADAGDEPVDPGEGTGRDVLDAMEDRLDRLRRVDDAVGGLDLAGRVDRRLRESIRLLGRIGTGGLRRRALRMVAGHAQLAGWVHADAGDQLAARRAYQVALHAAAVGEDRLLAAHVLGSLSHQSLAAADPDEALLLARSGLAGLGGDGPALVRVLLLHRVALAAARAGERREAEATLVQAGQAVERCVPGEAPEWLYWLDEAELLAMTGRCWAMLGRPLRAVRLLAGRPATAWPRAAALDGVWLARSYLQLGEVEQACWAAGRAWSDAVSAGSMRAADAVRHVHPLLLRHRDVPAVRRYRQLAELATGRLPVGEHHGRRRRPGARTLDERLAPAPRPTPWR